MFFYSETSIDAISRYITLYRTLRSALIYSNLGLSSSLGYEQVFMHVLHQFGDARSSLSYSDAHQLNT
jgi:hypothetical protein